MEQKPESAKNQGGRRSNGSIITSSQKNKNVTAWPFNASPDFIPLTSDSSGLEDGSPHGLYLCFCFFFYYGSNSGGMHSPKHKSSNSAAFYSRCVVVACCHTFIAFECQTQNFPKQWASNDCFRVFHSRQPTVPPSVPTQLVSLSI